MSRLDRKDNEKTPNDRFSEAIKDLAEQEGVTIYNSSGSRMFKVDERPSQSFHQVLIVTGKNPSVMDSNRRSHTLTPEMLMLLTGTMNRLANQYGLAPNGGWVEVDGAENNDTSHYSLAGWFQEFAPKTEIN